MGSFSSVLEVSKHLVESKQAAFTNGSQLFCTCLHGHRQKLKHTVAVEQNRFSLKGFLQRMWYRGKTSQSPTYQQQDQVN